VCKEAEEDEGGGERERLDESRPSRVVEGRDRVHKKLLVKKSGLPLEREPRLCARCSPRA